VPRAVRTLHPSQIVFVLVLTVHPSLLLKPLSLLHRSRLRAPPQQRIRLRWRVQVSRVVLSTASPLCPLWFHCYNVVCVTPRCINHSHHRLLIYFPDFHLLGLTVVTPSAAQQRKKVEADSAQAQALEQVQKLAAAEAERIRPLERQTCEFICFVSALLPASRHHYHHCLTEVYVH
jgi:hypothetical protein